MTRFGLVAIARGRHLDQTVRGIGAGSDLQKARRRGVVRAQQVSALERAVAHHSGERRARQQPAATDGAGDDVMAEAADDIADGAAPGDGIDVVERGMSSCPRFPYPGFPQRWMRMSWRLAHRWWYRARRYRPY